MASDKTGMPEGRVGQCESRLKTCRKCNVRFKAGDKSWECYKCGESRRCENDALTSRTACRAHGGKGGRPPSSTKIRIAPIWSTAYAHAVQHPELLSLATEIGVINARNDQLMERLRNIDVSSVHRDVLDAVNLIEEALLSGNTTMVARGITRLREAIDPINVESSVYYQLLNNFEIARRLTDTERKWATANQQTMDLSLVVELLILVTRIMMRYIPTHQDRAACAKEIRQYFPSGTDITVPT